MRKTCLSFPATIMRDKMGFSEELGEQERLDVP